MRPARGDTKPCDQPACAGIMQYARPERRGTVPGATEDDALRWICRDQAGHRLAGDGVGTTIVGSRSGDVRA